MGHHDRKQREKIKLRQNILNAAISIAKEEGWLSLTIRKIADEIEYTAPIVYEYFGSKEDLINELIKHGFTLLYKGIEDAKKRSRSPHEQLIELSLEHWEFAIKHHELYQLMFSLERPQKNEEALKAMEQIEDTFVNLTGKNKEEVKIYIFNWICLLHGTVNMFMRFQKSDIKPVPHKAQFDERAILIQFINRFINSIL